MDARRAVEDAAAAVAAADAEVTRTREERDEAMRDASATGAPTAQVARAARMARPQAHDVITDGAGRARGGDVLARVTTTAEAARAARAARREAVRARDAVLVQVTEDGELTVTEAARLAGVTPGAVSQARAKARALAQPPA